MDLILIFFIEDGLKTLSLNIKANLNFKVNAACKCALFKQYVEYLQRQNKNNNNTRGENKEKADNSQFFTHIPRSSR